MSYILPYSRAGRAHRPAHGPALYMFGYNKRSGEYKRRKSKYSLSHTMTCLMTSTSCVLIKYQVHYDAAPRSPSGPRYPGRGFESSEGPAVTSTPQLIAYYKVEAEGPEQAVEMAERVPHAKFGSVEVRQVVVYD